MKMHEDTLKNMICFGWPSLQRRELIEFCNWWLGGWKGCWRGWVVEGKRQELKRVVETSTLSVRVNTSSDVGNKSVWGAHSRGSKQRNNKWHAMRLNTMEPLRAERHRAKLLVQGCWLGSSASSAVNERSRKRFNQPSAWRISVTSLRGAIWGCPRVCRLVDTHPCSMLGWWGGLFCSALSCF